MPGTHTETLLDNLRAGKYYRGEKLGAFAPLRTQKALEDVRRRFLDVTAKPPPDFDPKVAHREISAVFKRTGSLESLAPRFQRQAPWVFFISLPGLPILGKQRVMVKALEDLLSSRRRPGLIASLLHCFFRDYPVDWESFDPLRTALRVLVKVPSARLERLREQCGRFSLLYVDGPRRLASQALSSDDAFEKTMVDAGFVDELGVGQFATMFFSALIGKVRTQLEKNSCDQPTLQRLLAYAELPDGLRFEAQKGELANALLEPFDDENPSGEFRKEIERFLVRHLRHPGANPGGWVGVSDKARQVMLRWLVGVTLDDFFFILDKTSPQGTYEANRWRYRKAFWSAYLKKDYIRDAWIAAGPDAQSLLRRKSEAFTGRYAELEGGSRWDCLLLLRIGTLLVADWSHTGCCRIWKAGNEKKLRLYLPRYVKGSSSFTYSPDEVVRHSGAASGVWQQRVANYITQHTSIRLGTAEYMPKEGS